MNVRETNGIKGRCQCSNIRLFSSFLKIHRLQNYILVSNTQVLYALSPSLVSVRRLTSKYSSSESLANRDKCLFITVQMRRKRPCMRLAFSVRGENHLLDWIGLDCVVMCCIGHAHCRTALVQ